MKNEGLSHIESMMSLVLALALPAFAIVIIFGTTAIAELQPLHESIEPESQDAPPLPCSGDFDWIQFRNGEWLKGEIKGLLFDEFSFESDELDSLDLDLEDIYAVCSPKWNTIVLDDRISMLGTLYLEGDAVTVMTSQGERHYNRAELNSIIPGGVTEWDYWSGKISLGLTTRSGNTSQSDASSFLRLQRRTPVLRTLLENTGNYGTFEGVETVNNQQTYLRHDIFVDDKLYIFAPIIQYYRDKFQNINYRLTPGGGLGYQLIDKGVLIMHLLCSQWMHGKISILMSRSHGIELRALSPERTAASRIVMIYE